MGSAVRRVSTPAVRNPGSTFCRRQSARTSNPEETSSTTVAGDFGDHQRRAQPFLAAADAAARTLAQSGEIAAAGAQGGEDAEGQRGESRNAGGGRQHAGVDHRGLRDRQRVRHQADQQRQRGEGQQDAGDAAAEGQQQALGE